MRYFAVLLKLCITASITLCTAYQASAQNALYQKVTIQANQQPVREVLNSMSRQGGFIFSYNSNILNADSVVTISVVDKTVQSVLEQLYPNKYYYKQTGKYLILQLDATKYWYVSGYIKDAKTGEGIKDVSVFEKDQLVASLTDGSGYFKIKLKDRYPSAQLSIKKSWYTDTAVMIAPGYDQEVNIHIEPQIFMMDSVVVGGLERTWWASFFLTSKQKAQSLNLGKFFVDRPYQASLVPGLSTHGRMSSITVNKASINLLGGYTGGVKGVEIGGLFNINKNDANYVQAAGLFNIVGDDMAGVQGSGLYNFVLDSVIGLQVAGISSMAGGDVIGIQGSGLYNHAGGNTMGLQAAGLANLTVKNMKGMQVAGLGNIAGGKVDGTQIAGIFNVSATEINGTQIAPFFNLAKRVDGAQIGLINVSDTSSGASIGFINIVFKGYHKLALYYNEAFDYNIAIKTGSHKLYNVFLGGINSQKQNLAFSVGYGFGSEWKLSKRFALAAEGTGQYVYLGSGDNTNILVKAHLNLNYKLHKFVIAFVGPTYNWYFTNQTTQITSEDGTYKLKLPRAGYGTTPIRDEGFSWVGGSIGLMFF